MQTCIDILSIAKYQFGMMRSCIHFKIFTFLTYIISLRDFKEIRIDFGQKRNTMLAGCFQIRFFMKTNEQKCLSMFSVIIPTLNTMHRHNKEKINFLNMTDNLITFPRHFQSLHSSLIDTIMPDS